MTKTEGKLSPFEVKDKIKDLHEALKPLVKGHVKVWKQNHLVMLLYMEVLEDIALGSIDAKTLAKTVLKVRPSWVL